MISQDEIDEVTKEDNRMAADIYDRAMQHIQDELQNYPPFELLERASHILSMVACTAFEQMHLLHTEETRTDPILQQIRMEGEEVQLELTFTGEFDELGDTPMDVVH